jgi:hypothetical protein
MAPKAPQKPRPPAYPRQSPAARPTARFDPRSPQRPAARPPTRDQSGAPRPGFVRAPETARRPPRDDVWEDPPEADRKLALSNVGGETQVAGDEELSSILADAMDVANVDKDRLTHGFHSYPARMHWATVARLVTRLDMGGSKLLDPFCGSGTVLIEGRARGCTTYGVDLSPFAVRLSRVKSDPLDASLRDDLRLDAGVLREKSEELVRARAKVLADLPPAEIGWYEPHVLKEMAGLFSLINEVENPRLREAFTFVFSSLVVKFSRQRSDTSEELVEKRVRKGLVSEFFERKTFELAERLAALAGESKGPLPDVAEGDARQLHAHATTRVDFIITSPPYGGTYDYVDHHARRLAWLGLTPTRMRAQELGSRRQGSDAGRFADEMRAALHSMRCVLVDDGLAILQMGDGQHGEQRVPADELIASLATGVGFRPLAVASQPRMDFRGGPPRGEHLMALQAV